MRRKAQYRCAISKRVCPFNDDFWEMGGADDAATDGCPIGKYEDNHHKEGKMFVFDDWCKHLRERKDERQGVVMGEKFIEFMLKNKPDFFKKISGEGFVDKQVLRHIICNVHKPEAVTMRQFATVITAIIEEISLIPNADAVPVVHGHWENKYERHYIFFGTCSVCKHVCQENNICGNCGAIMDESEEKQ